MVTTTVVQDANPCPPGLVPVPGTNPVLCTHGEDPPPPGRDPNEPVRLRGENPAEKQTTALQCDGDGQSGYRTQVLYVRDAGAASRFLETLPNIRLWVGQVDQIVADNAVATGGVRHVRWVHDAGCVPVVPEVILPAGAIKGFSQTIQALQAMGFNAANRDYLMFADTTDAGICGIGTWWGDEEPGPKNKSNTGPHYARVDAGCWGAATAAHELFHNMGAVNDSAPNSSKAGHCIDEYDIMCYSDSPSFPTMRIVCGDRVGDARTLDCGHDDYFHANPPASSYLATHWNTANNRFLIAGGTTPPPTPTATAVPPTMVPPTAVPTPVVTPTPDKKCKPPKKLTHGKCKRPRR
jgi:hypothetical protein